MATNVQGTFLSLAMLKVMGVMDQSFLRHGAADIPRLPKNLIIGSRSVVVLPTGLQVSTRLMPGLPSPTTSDEEDSGHPDLPSLILSPPTSAEKEDQSPKNLKGTLKCSALCPRYLAPQGPMQALVAVSHALGEPPLVAPHQEVTAPPSWPAPSLRTL